MPDFDALKAMTTGKCPGLKFESSTADRRMRHSFKGFITAPSDGEYTLYLRCDTGAEMWLHESHLIDDDLLTPAQKYRPHSASPQARIHFDLFYRHKSGPAKLRFEYSGPSIQREQVP